ncbi:MAG: hypothetical protein KAY32_15395 [Candidatus Eisenbacteria sp.]|nr:hypothetical protein [Candidatus Eisenbacteria bacterium]
METSIGPQKIDGLGGPLDIWQYKSCSAEVGVGQDWATVYVIVSQQEGQGHATRLLLDMKAYYEKKGLRFGGSVALHERMARLYRKCGIVEYD